MNIFIQLKKIVYSLTVAIFVVTVFGFFVSTNSAIAQTSTPGMQRSGNYGLDSVATKSGLKPEGSDGVIDVATFVGNIIRPVLGFVGTIFLLLVIYAGVTWMTAAGNDERITKAKKILVSASVGLALVILSYAIASFIADSVITSSSTAPSQPVGSCQHTNGCHDSLSEPVCYQLYTYSATWTENGVCQ